MEHSVHPLNVLCFELSEGGEYIWSTRGTMSPQSSTAADVGAFATASGGAAAVCSLVGTSTSPTHQ
jgi:hypothetical protein